MSQATVLRGVVWLTACLAAADTGAAAEPRRPPNVIVMLMDDMGWRDVGFMGNTFVETPHIDRLAREGLAFTQAYASAPNCAPTRACLMSGQYTPRHGIYTVVDPRQAAGSPWQKLLAARSESDLRSDIVTIPEVLREHGYATGFFGMWNLGRGREGPCTPGGQGFDRVVFPETVGFGKDAYRDEQGRFLGDRLGVELLDFVERNRGRPFFAYLADHAVHAPFDPPPDLLAKYERKAAAQSDRRNDAAQAATIEAVDRNVGRIVAALDSLGLADDTVLIFTSDNGGTTQFTAPLRGSKGELYEGGIRVPLVIWSRELTQKPATSDVPVATIDLYPTILELCAAAAPRGQTLDGVSLVPILQGRSIDRPRLFWHFPCYVGRATPSSAIREGDLKLIEFFEDGGRRELYDLRRDPGEEHDLAARQPAQVERLAARLEDWQKATAAALPARVNPAYDPRAERPRGGPGAGGKGGAKGPRGGRRPDTPR